MAPGCQSCALCLLKGLEVVCEAKSPRGLVPPTQSFTESPLLLSRLLVGFMLLLAPICLVTNSLIHLANTYQPHALVTRLRAEDTALPCLAFPSAEKEAFRASLPSAGWQLCCWLSSGALSPRGSPASPTLSLFPICSKRGCRWSPGTLPALRCWESNNCIVTEVT